MGQPATLVVGPSWVGDMVMAQSLFKVLQTRSPGTAIDVLAPAWSLPIVARMPEVRAGIDARSEHGRFGFRARRDLGVSLRGRYTEAIVLPRSFKSALVPWFAGVPRRTGYRGEMRFGLLNDVRPFDPSVLDQTVKRFANLGLAPGETLELPLPYPWLEVSADNQASVLDRLGLDRSKPVIAMMPGAEFGPAKCWPPAHFAALARLLRDDGYAVWVLGSAKDAVVGDEIVRRAGIGRGIANLCGQTSLADAIDLLQLAQQAVSNDSGLMHIAASVGTWVHAIYGSTLPGFAPPLTGRQTIHFLALECSPCRQRSCPLGHLNCLRQISAESVHAAIGRQA